MRYVTAGPWGPGTGIDHTAEEIDNLTWEVQQKIDDLDNLIGLGIANIQNVDGTVFQYWDDYLTKDTFFLPTGYYIYSGYYEPGNYARGELVWVPAYGLVWVAEDHEATADLLDADLEVGGLEAYVRQTGDALFRTVEISAATLGLLLNHERTYLRFTHALGCTVTVPAEEGVAFPEGAEIRMRAATAGLVTVGIFAAGIVVAPETGFSRSTNGEGSVIVLKKVGSDQWDLFGDLLPVPVVPAGSSLHMDFTAGQYFVGETAVPVTDLLGSSGTFDSVFNPAEITADGMAFSDTNMPAAIGALLTQLTAGLTDGLTVVCEIDVSNATVSGPMVYWYDDSTGVSIRGLIEEISGFARARLRRSFQTGFPQFDIQHDIEVSVLGIHRVAWTISRFTDPNWQYAINIDGDPNYETIALSSDTSNIVPGGNVWIGSWGDADFRLDGVLMRQLTIYPALDPAELPALTAL